MDFTIAWEYIVSLAAGWTWGCSCLTYLRPLVVYFPLTKYSCELLLLAHKLLSPLHTASMFHNLLLPSRDLYTTNYRFGTLSSQHHSDLGNTKSAVTTTLVILELRARQFNWRKSNLTVMTERTIYFSQERADVFAVHRQTPDWDHDGPPHLLVYPPSDVKGP